MSKINMRKELKGLYGPSATGCSIVDAPPLRFLMVDGSGDPNTAPEFRHAMEALYGLSYTLKFMLKKRDKSTDYVVMPLEGLWWADDMSLFSLEAKGTWRWTMMIAQPEHVTPELFAEAADELARKKNPPALAKARLDTYHEGLSAQVMHIGPYADERPTIEKIHRFIEEQGYARRGKHHEIYLSDPSRTAPEKLRTIIRQPISRG